jgi:hypothetical protein
MSEKVESELLFCLLFTSCACVVSGESISSIEHNTMYVLLSLAQIHIMLSGCELNDRVGILFCARIVESIFAWNFNSLVGLESGSYDTWQCDSAAECGLS